MSIPVPDKFLPDYRDPQNPNRFGPLIDAEYVEGLNRVNGVVNPNPSPLASVDVPQSMTTEAAFPDGVDMARATLWVEFETSVDRAIGDLTIPGWRYDAREIVAEAPNTSVGHHWGMTIVALIGVFYTGVGLALWRSPNGLWVLSPRTSGTVTVTATTPTVTLRDPRRLT